FQLDQKGKKTVRVERKSKDEGFALIKPEIADANNDVVADVISALRAEKVEDFVDAPETKLVQALSPSRATAVLSWETSDGGKSTLYFAEYEGKFWAASNPKTL